MATASLLVVVTLLTSVALAVTASSLRPAPAEATTVCVPCYYCPTGKYIGCPPSDWEFATAIPAGAYFNSISCPPEEGGGPASDCMAVGYEPAGDGDAALAMETTNDGGSWQTDTTESPPTEFEEVSCPEVGDCLAIAPGSPDVFAQGGVAGDGFTDETLQTLPAPSSDSGPTSLGEGDLDAISCPQVTAAEATPECFAVATDPNDGGSDIVWGELTTAGWSWEVVASDVEAYVPVGGAFTGPPLLDCVSDEDCTYTAGSSYSSVGFSATTSDGGHTWSSAFTGSLFIPWTISCPTSGYCLAGGSAPGQGGGDNEVDGTWQTPYTLNMYSISASYCFNATETCMLWGNGTPTLAVTTDGGASWGYPVTPSGSYEVSGLGCSDDGIACFAVGSEVLYTRLPAGDGCGGSETFGTSNEAESACDAAEDLTGLGPESGTVSTLSGNFSVRLGQFSLPGPGADGALNLSETYNSLATGATGPDGSPLGPGWSLSLGEWLDATSNGATVTTGDGATVSFEDPVDGSCTNGYELGPSTGGGTPFCAPDRVEATLVQNSDGSYTYVLHNLITVNFYPGGLVESSTDPNGNTTLYCYSGTQLASVTNGLWTGTAVTSAWAVSTCESIASGEDTTGRTLTFDYYSGGAYNDQLESVTDPLGRTVGFGYNADDELVSITTGAGETSFTYNGGELSTILSPAQQPSGSATQIAYCATGVPGCPDGSAPGVVSSVTDPAGDEDSFSYSGEPSELIGGSTTVTTVYPDDSTNPLVTLDQFVDGELYSTMSALGQDAQRITTFTYDPVSTNIATMVDPDGGTTQFAYDTEGDLTCEVSPDESAAGVSCNPEGSPYVPDTTGYTYNEYGEVLTETLPDGAATTNKYSDDDTGPNLVESELGGSDGLVTQYGYYSNGELACEVSPDETAAGKACDSPPVAGQSGATTDTYDGDGDLTSTTDPMGDTTSYGYDADGEQTCEVSPDETASTTDPVSCPASPSNSSSPPAWQAGETFTTYDPTGEVATVTDPMGNEVTYNYDADGNEQSIYSPGAEAPSYTQMSYDGDDRLTKTQAGEASLGGAATSVTEEGYDQAPGSTGCPSDPPDTAYCDFTDRVTGTGASPTNLYTGDYYDASNRLIEEQTPESATTYAYDVPCPASVPGGTEYCDSSTNGLGTTTDAYDADGNVLATDYTGSPGDTALDETFAYDADNRLSSETLNPDGAGGTSPTETAYSYDDYGRTTSVGTSPGTTTTYGYDADGNLTCISYPVSSGPSCNDAGTNSGDGIVNYFYNAADEMTELKDWNGRVTQFSPDHDGNLTQTSYPGGTAVRTAFDDNDEMLSSELENGTTDLAQVSYGTDRLPDESIAGETDSGTELPATSTSYSYDAADQVTEASGASLSYESDGNPIDFENGLSLVTGGSNASPASDELTGAAAGTGTYQYTASYSYNAVGERTGSTATAGAQQTSSPPPLPVGTQNGYDYDQAGQLTSVDTTGNLVDRMDVSSDHSLFVDTSGNVWAAGLDSDGQLGVDPSELPSSCTASASECPSPVEVAQPSGVGAVSAVAAGVGFSVELAADGTVWTFGSNQYGELGTGKTPTQLASTSTPTEVSGLPDSDGDYIVAVSANSGFALALSTEGNVYAWGRDNEGQLGNGGTTGQDSAVEVESPSGSGPLSGITSISAGSDFALAVCDPSFDVPGGGNPSCSGHTYSDVYAWGDDGEGQLGNGVTGTTPGSPPALVLDPTGAVLSGVTEVSAGTETAVALCTEAGCDGEVYTWGDNDDSQLGQGEQDPELPYADEAGLVVDTTSGQPLTGIAQISKGDNDSAVAVGLNGAIYDFGNNSDGQYGDGNTTNNDDDIAKQEGGGAVEVVEGANSVLEALPSGQIVAFGADSDGQLGTGSTATSVDSPQPLSQPSTGNITAVGTNDYPASFTYGPNGLRASETVGGATEDFTYDTVSSSVPRLLSDGVNDYIYGPDGTAVEQIAVSNGATYYYFSDALGSTRALVDIDGKVDATFSYDSYGALSGETGDVTTPMLYAGGDYDAATQLYYLIGRYYDPGTGEFLSVDPDVDETGQPYAYAGGDPVNGRDPSGEFEAGPNGQLCNGEGGCNTGATTFTAAQFFAVRDLDDEQCNGHCQFEVALTQANIPKAPSFLDELGQTASQTVSDVGGWIDKHKVQIAFVAAGVLLFAGGVTFLAVVGPSLLESWEATVAAGNVVEITSLVAKAAFVVAPGVGLLGAGSYVGAHAWIK